MKAISKTRGFALVETLIVSVATVILFGFLYSIVYPLSGAYKSTERYEDLDTKYIAFYIKAMLESDKNVKSVDGGVEVSSFDVMSINSSDTGLDGYKGFQTLAYECVMSGGECATNSDGSTRYQSNPVSSKIAYGVLINDTTSNRYTIRNSLCEKLGQTDNKNNKFACNNFVQAARITRMFIVTYDTRNFKDKVKNCYYISSDDSCSRMLKEYVKFMPTHAAASNATNRRLLIVEVQHDSYNTSGDYYYTYASIEVK